MKCHSAVAIHLDTKKVVFWGFFVRLFLTPLMLRILDSSSKEQLPGMTQDYERTSGQGEES